jgi:hypothetical protein
LSAWTSEMSTSSISASSRVFSAMSINTPYPMTLAELSINFETTGKSLRTTALAQR